MKKAPVLLFFCIVSFFLTAQTRWEKYDSIYAENLFTPNFSSLLMPKGYVEVIVSNSLLSSNKAWSDKSGDPKIDLGRRYTYDYTTAIVNIGVSEKTRFNAGVEIHYAKGYQDSDPTSSPFTIFKRSPPGYVAKEQALTSVGPRIKWRPFKRKLNFVYISTVQLPLLSDSAKESVLGQSRVQWGNTFLYSFSAGKKFSFFVQDDIYFYFKKGEGAHTQALNAVNVYGYLLVSKHVFPFVSVGYSGVYSADGGHGKIQNQYIPLGAGLQYQYSLRFTFNIYYNQYAWAKNYTDWKTLNAGVRAVF